jgi:hypothetical protein
MSLVEYRNYTTVVRKELGEGVFAVTDTKLVANKRSRGNESTVASQRVAVSDSFTVHPRTLRPDSGAEVRGSSSSVGMQEAL